MSQHNTATPQTLTKAALEGGMNKGNEMEAKHTATPTQSSGNALQLCDSSTGHCVANVAFCDTTERAKAIVRACNAHEGLVKTLQALRKFPGMNFIERDAMIDAALAKAEAA